MTTRQTEGEPSAAPDSFSVATRRREFELLLAASGGCLVLPVILSSLAVGNGVNPLALGWLLVIFLSPSVIVFVTALFFTRRYVYRVDASGVHLTSRGKTLADLSWDRVRRVQHGPLHVRQRRMRLRGLLLVVHGVDGRGVFLSTLRHDIPTRTILQAIESTTRLAEAHGVEVLECEILERDRWEPLGGLGR